MRSGGRHWPAASRSPVSVQEINGAVARMRGPTEPSTAVIASIKAAHRIEHTIQSRITPERRSSAKQPYARKPEHVKVRIADRIAAVRQTNAAPELHVSSIEPHYTPEEIAKLWKVSVCKVRRDFRDRSGVLKFVSRRAGTSASTRRCASPNRCLTDFTRSAGDETWRYYDEHV
jgi:hypothetical protein